MSHRSLGIAGFSIVVIIVILGAAGRARAWGPDGHKTVAAIADKLIAGTKAADQVHALLGTTSLEDAAVWADCAKGVQAKGTPLVFTYEGAGNYPECAPFETPAAEAEMVDFVKRNFDACSPKPGEETCHKQYHYSDISISHAAYAPTLVGARPDDIVNAVAATIAVLQGRPAPAPFSIKNQREALLLLFHYVGDIHQPLHVGAIYLDAAGHRVDPDATGQDPATETRGGNNILLGGGKNFHAAWDNIPTPLTAGNVDDQWLANAKKVATTSGAIATWSTAWATASVKDARKAFQGLTFGSRWQDAKGQEKWSATLPRTYDASMAKAKRVQLTNGGARLGQVLKAIWP